MPKQLSQKAVKAKLDHWGLKQKAIAKAQAARDAALEPILARHEEELAAASAKHDKKIELLQAQSWALETEIREWLKSYGKPIELEGSLAVAKFETGTKLGPRVINVKSFLEKAKTKGDEMYKCITILVKEAEKLLGKKEVDKISTRPSAPTTDITVDLKD